MIENGKIKNIAKKIQYEAADLSVIDLKECYVYPGFIDCHTHLGIMEEGAKLGVADNEDSNPVTPELRAIDGINPQDTAFKDAASH